MTGTSVLLDQRQDLLEGDLFAGDRVDDGPARADGQRGRQGLDLAAVDAERHVDDVSATACDGPGQHVDLVHSRGADVDVEDVGAGRHLGQGLFARPRSDRRRAALRPGASCRWG